MLESTLGRIGYRRSIGILGGSFNPPHPGHVHISKVSLRMFNLGQIYWVYTKKNPLKKVSPSVLMIGSRNQKLVKSPNIKLSPIEIRHNFQYSFQLLKFIQKRHRHIKFIWVMVKIILFNSIFGKTGNG